MIKINNVRLIQSVLDQGFLLPDSGGFLLNGLKCISTKTKGKRDNLSTASWSTPNPPGLTPMEQREPISFDDYKNAFKEKSLKEMTRALFVLRLCSYNYVVDNSLKLMHLTEQTLGSTLFSSIMKTTMYGQFVAGEDKNTIQETTKKLRKSGIEPMLALPMEEDVEEGCRESRFDGNLEAVLDCMRLSAELDSKHPMMQIKVTGLMSGDLCAKVSSICPAPHGDVIDHVRAVMAGNAECNVLGLTAEENASFQAALGRFREIGEMSRRFGVLVWVDAEYTYMNPALNLVSLAMMLNYNQDRPLIGYTYQNYLKTTFDRLRRDVEFIEGRGVCFAAKLVRGAYMDKERALARSEGYEDPVHATLADTNNTYHKSMTLMLNKVSQNPEKFAVILATHNEETVQLAIKLINDLSLDRRCGRVFFGQVLGMCDQVSYSLGIGDYLVYKSLPYGSVKETLPYLCRRAQENRSVLHRVGRERTLLRKAVLYRLTGLS